MRLAKYVVSLLLGQYSLCSTSWFAYLVCYINDTWILENKSFSTLHETSALILFDTPKPENSRLVIYYPERFCAACVNTRHDEYRAAHLKDKR